MPWPPRRQSHCLRCALLLSIALFIAARVPSSSGPDLGDWIVSIRAPDGLLSDISENAISSLKGDGLGLQAVLRLMAGPCSQDRTLSRHRARADRQATGGRRVRRTPQTTPGHPPRTQLLRRGDAWVCPEWAETDRCHWGADSW